MGGTVRPQRPTEPPTVGSTRSQPSLGGGGAGPGRGGRPARGARGVGGSGAAREARVLKRPPAMLKPTGSGDASHASDVGGEIDTRERRGGAAAGPPPPGGRRRRRGRRSAAGPPGPPRPPSPPARSTTAPATASQADSNYRTTTYVSPENRRTPGSPLGDSHLRSPRALGDAPRPRPVPPARRRA
jgi:hypothetical protein